MIPIRHIRKVILGLNQVDFASIAGTRQATVSDWERGISIPRQDHMAAIRDYARAKGIPWDDKLFFEIPAQSA